MVEGGQNIGKVKQVAQYLLNIILNALVAIRQEIL
jgi:hypothetical protein